MIPILFNHDNQNPLGFGGEHAEPLFTNENFGCVQFKPKEESGPVR